MRAANNSKTPVAISAEQLQRAHALSSATLHEAAGRRGALTADLRPLSNGLRMCGVALPVSTPPGDNLWLHHAIRAANAGEVLVVDTKGGWEFGYWGEVMTVAAMMRNIAGLVIDGGVRDSTRLVELSFPVFSRAISIRGTGKNPCGNGAIGEPVLLGDVTVRRGDLVLGDADGVVILPPENIDNLLAEAEARERKEQAILDRLRRGETTIAVYGLPEPGAH